MGPYIATATTVIIILLMMAVGLQMTRRALMLLWCRPKLLAGTVVAAFLVVPAMAYLILQAIPLSFADKAGLWVLAIAPGAPMIHTAASRRTIGDHELAASYQVTVALLVVIFAPLWLVVISVITGGSYRMDPFTVLRQVSVIQLIPILVGLAIGQRWPDNARRIGVTAEKAGLAALLLLVVLIFAVFAKRIIASIEGWELMAAALIAISAALAGHFLAGPDLATRATMANANTQRNIGLALAIAAWNLPAERGPIALVIVLYALIALLTQQVYTKICLARSSGETQ